jgi:hypothetical protein
MSLTKLSLGGNNLYMTSLFPHRESLVSDIPLGTGILKSLFYGVYCSNLLKRSSDCCMKVGERRNLRISMLIPAFLSWALGLIAALPTMSG